MNITMIRLMMRSLNVFTPILLLLTCIVPLLSPQIPPFIGYFFCRVIHHGFFGGQDICGLEEDDIIQSILSSLKIELVSLNIFRLLGLIASILLITPPLWNAALIIVYEILPSLLFQKQCLNQINERTRLCRPRNFMVILRKYKELQILNIMFNEIYPKKTFPYWVWTIHSNRRSNWIPPTYHVQWSFHCSLHCILRFYNGVYHTLGNVYYGEFSLG
jgi:hypothetical protein